MAMAPEFGVKYETGASHIFLSVLFLIVQKDGKANGSGLPIRPIILGIFWFLLCHSRDSTGLPSSSCAFSSISFFVFPTFKINFISLQIPFHHYLRMQSKKPLRFYFNWTTKLKLATISALIIVRKVRQK